MLTYLLHLSTIPVTLGVCLLYIPKFEVMICDNIWPWKVKGKNDMHISTTHAKFRIWGHADKCVIGNIMQTLNQGYHTSKRALARLTLQNKISNQNSSG